MFLTFSLKRRFGQFSTAFPADGSKESNIKDGSLANFEEGTFEEMPQFVDEEWVRNRTNKKNNLEVFVALSSTRPAQATLQLFSL